MTAQVPDSMWWNGNPHSVVASTDKMIFNLTSYFTPLRPKMLSTGCYRGYIAKFALDKSSNLIIQHLLINSPDVCALINGIPPYCAYNPSKGVNGRSSSLSYDEVDLKIPIHGTVRICRNFIRSMYFHGGFQHFLCFENVVDLVFEKGALTDSKDLSDEIAQLRAILKDGSEGGSDVPDSAIASVFYRNTNHPRFVEFRNKHGDF